jgi:hypothetical protein
MTISLKHTFASAKTDSADATLVQPSNWNQEHVLTAAAGKVLGRDTSGAGAVQELPISVTSAGNVTIPNNFAVTGTTTLTDLNATGTVGFTNALGVTSGGTGAATLTANNVLIGNGTSAVTSVAPGTSGNLLTSNGTTWASTAAPASGVNFPQSIQSANYTLVIGDAGKQIFHPVADTTVRTYTIPANASVAFTIGTVVLFTVENGGTAVNVAITSDTLVNGNGFTGTQNVQPNNTLMCIKVTATKWMANYLYQRDARSRSQVAVVGGGNPYVTVYDWSTAGFGAKYADPATQPTGSCTAVAFTPAGDAIAVSHAITPFITAYPWSGSTGFGAKYTDPATLPTGTAQGVAFSPAGDAIAVGHGTTPFITAYPWNSSTGFGTKYANPATLPASTGNGVTFSPAGDAIAVVHGASPFITAYPWNVSTGFGTKYTNPATLPASGGNGVAFNPAGTSIAVAHTTTPFITAYPWSVGGGFGTKYTNPATLPTGTGRSVSFSPAGNAIAVAHDTSPFISAYPWSSTGFGTKYADPTTLPALAALSVTFSAAGDTIFMAIGNTISQAYAWGAAGFGAKYANPGSGTGFNQSGIAFNTSF